MEAVRALAAWFCSLGRWERFWDPDSYSAVRLETDDAVFEKMVYVLANPVAAGLVRRGREWPGLWSDAKPIGGDAIVTERPPEFFRELGTMPAAACLQLHSPPGFETDGAFPEHLSEALRDAEDLDAAEFPSEGRSFLGTARVLAQKPHAHPAPGEPRRGLNPQVACRAKWKRIEALQRLEAFRIAYRKARGAWRAGLRDALFPSGTWLMRVPHAAACGAYG